MTAPVLPEASETNPTFLLGLQARVCIWSAYILCMCPPRLIGKVLEFLARGAKIANEATVRECRHTVISLSVKCAGAGCLPRSVATYLLVRLQGMRCGWAVGTRVQPFAAHAWVTLEGAAIGEPASVDEFHVLIQVNS